MDKWRDIKMVTKNPNKMIIHKTYAELIIEHLWYDLKVKISIEDVERVSQYRWVLRSNVNTRYKYFSASDKGKPIMLHRFIVNCPDNMVVDHINHKTLDNRRCNLRICTAAENSQNNRNNKSGFANIHKLKNSNSWRFQRTINGKRYSFCSTDLQKVIEYKNNLK